MAKRFIAIAGNIGAGKTELTRFLCRRYDLKPFYEPNDQNPYLADFYQDMKTWAFRSQIFFLTHKARLHRSLEKDSGTAIQDRTIYEDAEIFARNLHRQRYIDKRDWATYWELYETINATLKPPDLMIYLRCPVRALKARIKLRGREMEQSNSVISVMSSVVCSRKAVMSSTTPCTCSSSVRTHHSASNTATEACGFPGSKLKR